MLCKSQSTLFLIIALLGVCLTQKISVPIKSTNGTLFLSTTYGSQKCSIDMRFSFHVCTNWIYLPYDTIKSCGSQLISHRWGDTYYSDARFSFYNTQADLSFASPNHFYPEWVEGLESSFCFTEEDNLSDRFNAVVELFDQKLISEKKVFMTFNKSSIQSNRNEVIGSLDIGMPDSTQYKGSFTELTSDTTFNLKSGRNVTFFGETIDNNYTINLNTDSAYTQVSITVFDKILSILQENGITYTETADQVILPSIAKLEPIEIPVFQENSQNFYTIKLLPNKFTRKLENGTYELMIKKKDAFFYLGNTIFESYYVGFDIVTGRILFAEKRNSNELKNFRGEQQ